MEKIIASLEQFKSTFKITSYDKRHKFHLYDDETKIVYNFDDICCGEFKSADALVIKNKTIFLIEFKNSAPFYQKKKKKKNPNDDDEYIIVKDNQKSENISLRVNLKMYDSILVLGEFLKNISVINKSRDILDFDLRYIFVYSKAKEDLLDADLLNRSRRNVTDSYYDFDRYKGKIVSKIATLNDEDFINKIASQF